MSIYDPFSFHVLMLIAGHQCEHALFFQIYTPDFEHGGN